MTDKRLTELAKSLPASVPFVGPEAMERARGAAFQSRLGANESVFGPSPRAVEAMAEAASEAWKYGDPEMIDLRQALAAHHEIDAKHIIVGEGIDGLLGLVARLIVSPGDRVVTSAGAYPTFDYHVAGFGGEIIRVPYRNDAEDPAALLSKATEVKAKLIYWSNPDNPMGTWHPAGVVSRAISHVPPGALLVLDEAYIDTAPAGTAPALDPADARVIRMRTFSKAYGLAGARVGYAIGPAALISAFDRVRNHFGMSRVSQAAAIAALSDQDHLAETLRAIQASRSELTRIARENKLTALPSATNFVTIDCGRDGSHAVLVLEGLLKRGIFVRKPMVPPLDRCIRVSCGRPEDMAAFSKALPEALEEASG
ncbi:MAG: pyridoxal phosphate-dependent aminotransferase [Pseudomonadota bacterium]